MAVLDNILAILGKYTHEIELCEWFVDKILVQSSDVRVPDLYLYDMDLVFFILLKFKVSVREWLCVCLILLKCLIYKGFERFRCCEFGNIFVSNLVLKREIFAEFDGSLIN